MTLMTMFEDAATWIILLSGGHHGEVETNLNLAEILSGRQMVVEKISSSPLCSFFLPQNEGFMGLEQGQFPILSVDVHENIGQLLRLV